MLFEWLSQKLFTNTVKYKVFAAGFVNSLFHSNDYQNDCIINVAKIIYSLLPFLTFLNVM